MADIRTWLEDHGLGAYAETFMANDVDLAALPHLTEGDLREMGLSLGHRRRLMAEIAAIAGAKATDAEPLQPPQPPAVERRLLTVMFVDIVGSTQFASTLDPEEMHDLVRNYQIAVTGAVVRYDGYIAKFMGDGVLAYFGWPRAHEDEAERAVRAARDLLKAVASLPIPGGNPLRVRVGIATGEVVVGTIVGELTTDDEAVVGTAPGLADRLQRIAPSGDIVIGPETKRLLGGAFALQPWGPRELKGFAEPVEVWRVIDEIPAETRFEAIQSGRMTALTGRDHELGLLMERWRLAQDGEGQAIAISGEAGIGKSRLVNEFRRRVAEDPHFEIHYQCSSYHTNSALHPAVEQIKRAAGISEACSAEVTIQKLENLAQLISGQGADLVPVLAALLRVPCGAGYAALDLPPQQLRQRIIRVLVEMIVSLSARQPVLVVVEDSHWADPTTMDLVDELLAATAASPVMIVLTQRTGSAVDLLAHPDLTAITLNRVGRRHAAAIAVGVGGGALTETTLAKIVDRADGVPLFVEELAKAVAETDEARDQRDEPVPMTLQSSLVARLDRLGTAKQVAQLGAVIGREFSEDLLVALAERAGTPCDGALDRLRASDLMICRGVGGKAICSFKHALLQDAAYATLLISRRRALHRLIVEMLEEGPDGGRDQIDLLAHHAERAEAWQKAYRCFFEAARDSVARSALREAIGYFERALAAADHLPGSQALSEETIDLRFELRNALWATGRFADILVYLDDAERLASGLQDRVRLGWVAVYRGASLWQIGQSEVAEAAVQTARTIAVAEEDRCLQVASDFYLGCVSVTTGDCLTAERHFNNVVDSLPGDLAKTKCGLPFAPVVIARSWLVWALAERGDFAGAETQGQLAVALAEEIDNPFNLAHIYYDIGYHKIVQRDFDAAIAALQTSADVIEKWNLLYLSPFTLGFLGHAYVQAGKVDRGLELLEEAAGRYARMGLGLFRSLVEMQLAEALLVAGRPAEAQRRLDDALRLAGSRGERGHVAFGLYVQAKLDAAAYGANDSRTRESYERAAKIALQLGMMPLASLCRGSIADRPRRLSG